MLLNKASPVFFLTILLIMFAVSARASAPQGELQAPLKVEVAILAPTSTPVVADEAAPVDVLKPVFTADAAPALRNDDGGVSGNTIKNASITVQPKAEDYMYAVNAQPGNSALLFPPENDTGRNYLKADAHNHSGNRSRNAQKLSSGGLDGRISPYFAS